MAVEQGRDWDLECRITRCDGALRWIWVCGRLRHDESGQPRRLVGIVLDITARKQAEEERERLLEENSDHREFLEQLMHALPVGVAVVGGPDYRFEFVNPYFEAAAGLALPGVSNLAMVGCAYADALPHMATRGITSLLDQARRMGKTASVHEFGVTMAPGRDETYWNVDHVPLHDGGRADRILILVSEVTAQVRARKQIEQLAARDEAILNNMTEGVMIADEQGNVLGINPAARRIHSHTDDENVDRPMVTFVPSFELRSPDGQALPVEQWPLPRVLRGETLAAYELVVQRTDEGQ